MNRFLERGLLLAASLGLIGAGDASNVALASVNPSASTNCTDAASKAVNWEIRNFTFDTDTRYYYGPGTAGKVSFSIKNSANGYEFNCLQGNGQTSRTPNHFLAAGKVWYSCNVYCQGSQFFGGEDNPALNTTFHFDIESKELSINQAWTCGDRESNNAKQTTIYNALGSSVVSSTSCSQIPSLRQDQVACTPADVTIKATNVSTGIPIVLEDLDEVDSGVYTNPPRNGQASAKPGIQHNTLGCTKRSHSPSWTVTGFIPTVYGAGFTVTNNALNYTTRCDLQDYSLNGADKPANKMARSSWWNCSRYDDSHATYPYDSVYTQVLIGGPQNLLGINQTWYCDDEDPTSPTIFSAYAESKYRTDCNHTRACYNVQYQAQPVLQSEDRCSVKNMALSASRVNEIKVSKDKAR